MGQEIARSHFNKQDFHTFNSRLREETALVKRWFEEKCFAMAPSTGGFELEAWLVDKKGLPAPINQKYLEHLNSPLVVPELSVFNVELNTDPRVLRADVLSRMHTALEKLWSQCNEAAADLDASLLMIGILPSVLEQDMSISNISQWTRYRALNEQVMRQRHGKPLMLDIRGRERLRIEYENVMLEAAATSFQVHLQVNQDLAARYFNASLILSALMVAVAANSPFAFGRNLWEETRIPIFEQSVAVGYDDIHSQKKQKNKKQHLPRVTFGSGYVRSSLLEIFLENLEYPSLLPMVLNQPLEQVNHLRLQNGTLWRWNRPLIGFDALGTPHLRIEHRVMAAGPSVADTIANAALFYGLVHFYAEQAVPPETLLSFEDCRNNFYTAARLGLEAKVKWLDGKTVVLRQLLLEELPLARQGLEKLAINQNDIQTYLDIIEARVSSGRTGASWQRDFVKRYGPDMSALTSAYLERQRLGKPVHEWSLIC